MVFAWPLKTMRERNAVTPIENMLMAIPATIWLTPSETASTASTTAISAPADMPVTNPTIGRPVKKVPTAAPKAPASIMPSRPML